MLNIAIVEDHPEAREALSNVLGQLPGFHVLAPCKDLAQGMRLVEDICPDVLLVDLQLPGGSGLNIIRQAHHRWGDSCVSAVLIASKNEEYLLEAIHAGAKGFLVKIPPPEEWQHTVLMLARGHSPLNSALASIFKRELPDLKNSKTTPNALNPLPGDFLQHLAAGYTFEELQPVLGIDVDQAGRMARRLYEQIHDAVCKQGKHGLSVQQMQLLSLMGQFEAKSFQELALLMGIKESSVKTQAQRIYEKLGVHSRIEAVAEARHRGLIP